MIIEPTSCTRFIVTVCVLILVGVLVVVGWWIILSVLDNGGREVTMDVMVVEGVQVEVRLGVCVSVSVMVGVKDAVCEADGVYVEVFSTGKKGVSVSLYSKAVLEIVIWPSFRVGLETKLTALSSEGAQAARSTQPTARIIPLWLFICHPIQSYIMDPSLHSTILIGHPSKSTRYSNDLHFHPDALFRNNDPGETIKINPLHKSIHPGLKSPSARGWFGLDDLCRED
jgi:hypothetical protein